MKYLLLCLLLILPVPIFAQVTQKSTYNEIAYEVATRATTAGVDVKTALYIADRESGMRPNAVGDHGTSIGLVQIHLPAHPSISRQQALDPEFAVSFLITELSKGNCKIWSTCPTRSI